MLVLLVAILTSYAAAQTTANQIIVESLQNERDEGFNFYLPGPGGLFINWVYTAAPPPDQVNLNSLGVPDSDPASRHDRLTDLVYLADLARYVQVFPDDHQFDGEISKYTNIVAQEFNGHIDDRGWVYFLFKEMATSLPAFAGYAEAMADNYDRRVKGNIRKFGAAVPIHISASSDPQGSYRCDETIEEAMALVDSGAARSFSDYVADGQALLSFVQSSCYATPFQIWAMEMGHIFTDSSRAVLNSFDQEVIKSGLMKAGGLSEILESFCYGEIAAPGNGFGVLAQSTLDQLLPSPSTQGFGLWDSAFGGYYQGIRLNGDSIANVTGYTVANSYKEVGRMATFLRTFAACNRALGGRYANAIAPMTQSIVNSYYHDGHGWPYQENNDFTLFTGYGVTQNWVTSEATGHASRALLTTALTAAEANSEFVGMQGTQFVYQGSTITFYGSTFYPSVISGTAAWHSTTFPSYIDQMIALAQKGGLNILRPTDFFFKNKPGQNPYDPVVWSNMDYLVSACKDHGLFVIMDISAYRWLLESDGLNSTDPNNWYTFIDFVATRYGNDPTIAFYYVMGEPTVPNDGPSADALVAFFDGVTTRFRTDDTHHLICAGGFNHMMDHPELSWWQRIYSLPNNDIGGYKTYSQHDLDYTSTVTSYTGSIQKPAFEAEFGMPQYMGDCEWSGATYNGINTDRADFFVNVYSVGLAGGTAAFVFWNLGNQTGDSSYNVSPTVSPCTWSVIQQYSAPPPS